METGSPIMIGIGMVLSICWSDPWDIYHVRQIDLVLWCFDDRTREEKIVELHFYLLYILI